ncbi:uracil phosphoribosyltransferase [Aquimarina brevivitae]|uniref:Uracil phosphoribosyltransferase n=1 Tax=Aquimarina brevivitae TaxID=323412 RepID=A0A4V2F7F3_9FLAO|nr:uracil phosphoribosyltransferase [Aquimarina brevivitae]RZS99619.1 uracil phosphoribosyltransferase [Aquimarina brevivitae]
MKIHNLSNQNSIVHHFIAQLRDINIQKDSMRFRRNIERIGEVLGYELSKHLEYQEIDVTTPLGVASSKKVQDSLVICSILRAGLPLHNGLLHYFDDSENAFISAFRKHTTDTEFDIEVKYLAAPTITDKVLIMADPMLATGKTIENTYQVLKERGTAKQIHVVAVIGSQEGVDYIAQFLPKDAHLWIATIDPELNDHKYIVPGLGDAGDLSFGQKL